MWTQHGGRRRLVCSPWTTGSWVRSDPKHKTFQYNCYLKLIQYLTRYSLDPSKHQDLYQKGEYVPKSAKWNPEQADSWSDVFPKMLFGSSKYHSKIMSVHLQREEHVSNYVLYPSFCWKLNPMFTSNLCIRKPKGTDRWQRKTSWDKSKRLGNSFHQTLKSSCWMQPAWLSISITAEILCTLSKGWQTIN